MSDVFERAEYLTLPELSPYVRTDRFDQPKEIFKHVVGKLKTLVDPTRSYRYADIACANGEFLYYLKQEFPHWELSGFDSEAAFIDVARGFEGLDGVRFEVRDLFDIDETFDIVSFMGVMSTFFEPFEPLDKLVALCNDGGWVFADGYFNEYEVEVRVVYCDNSAPEGRGKWRRDWNQHTQASIRDFLGDRRSRIEFEDVVMGVELPRDPSKPHINAWTSKDAGGRNLITNGTKMLLNDVMLVVTK